MRKEIRKLKEEQEKDRYSPIVKPQIIQPTRKLDLSMLTFKEKVTWTCIKAGAVSKVAIAKFLHKHPDTIWRIYRRAQKKMEKCKRD